MVAYMIACLVNGQPHVPVIHTCVLTREDLDEGYMHCCQQATTLRTADNLLVSVTVSPS